MNNYVIITDSCCDLTNELAENLKLPVIPLSVNVNNAEYKNYLDARELDIKEFYGYLRNGIMATTSAINLDTFTTVFEEYLIQGIDVLYLSFSSGLSATHHVSTIATEELSEKYPERKIYSVDTLCASMGQGLLVYLTVMQKNSGKTIEEARDFAENNKLNLCHWFTVDDLNHLKRGGRVSSAAALVGSMLNIKPVLHVDDEGHLINVSKVRGRKASITALLDNMKNTAITPEEQTVFISHGDCLEEAQLLTELVKKELKVKNVLLNNIGPTIGAHSGPGTIALFFLGTKR